MQTTSCYPLTAYTTMNSDQTPSAKSVDDILPSIHLLIHATVRCQTALDNPQSASFQQEFPTWKRFIGEIEQYVGKENRVTSNPIYLML